MVTGRDALFSVEQAIGRVRADESQLDGALRSAIDEAARLRREEAEGFRVLARIKLDGMVREQVVQELDATERRALAMLDGHRKALETLAQRRDAAQAALTKAEEIKHERDQVLAEILEQIDELRGATAERVRTDPAWQAAKAAVDDAQRIAEASESKAKVSEEDLAEKRQPYEADPLFMYLWKKKHGTGEDRSSNFVRWLDRKVAALIGYADARPNYAMLNEIPLRLREHAKQKLDDVTAAKERLAAVEQAALAASGSQPLEAKAAAAHQAVQAAEQQVAKATAELHQIDADHEKSIGAGDEAAYGGAIDLLAQSLAREDMRALYRDAYETPTPADEQALNAIANARKKLEKADAEVAQIRNQIREIAKRRSELEGARDRARSQGYDSPLGTIANSAILAQVLTGILQGAMRGSDLDKVFRDNYRRREPRADPDFGGPGSWGGGSGPWGGSSGGSPWGGGGGGGGSWGGGGGGGGSSGGGGGGGGGWKTGGSF